MLPSKTPLLFWTLCASSLACSTPAPSVHLESSDVRFTGTLSNDTESFLNIRFGQDTSGSNRFAPPKPYTYPSGSVVNASQSGAACPQAQDPDADFPLFANVTDISEDCLTLRIDRPANTSSSSPLPVLVFIYGGGDTIGQIYDPIYDPTSLVASAAQKDLPIIYVAMNYRLGIFGFASSPALNETDSLNSGLLDQRLALWWIQENIAAFGGDPDQVTIFGESDGATGVALQMTAYGGKVSKAPFRRAVMESGGATADTGTSTNVSGERTAEVIELVNCTSSSNNSMEELECLRKVPMLTLLNVATDVEVAIAGTGGFDVFIPTSPSTFIPDSPSTLLKTGQFVRDIDVISGWAENDGAFFTSTELYSSSDVAEFFAEYYPGLTNASIAQALALYPISQFSNDTSVDPPIDAQYFRASQMQRDCMMTCVSLLAVQANAQYASSPSVSSYLYALNQTVFTAFLDAEGTSYYGVPHFSDIPYIFNEVSTDPDFAPIATTSDIQTASEMSASWAAFATYGDPSRVNGTIAGWSQALPVGSGPSTSSYNVQVIGGPNARFASTGSAPGDYNEDLVKRCAFWNSPEVLAELGL
jgi:carboxylesterase type B